MSRRGHDVTVLEWIIHALSCDKSTDMCDIGHQIGSNTVSNFPVPSVVEISRITTGTAQQDVRSKFCHNTLKNIHIDLACLSVHIVGL